MGEIPKDLFSPFCKVHCGLRRLDLIVNLFEEKNEERVKGIDEYGG